MALVVVVTASTVACGFIELDDIAARVVKWKAKSRERIEATVEFFKEPDYPCLVEVHGTKGSYLGSVRVDPAEGWTQNIVIRLKKPKAYLAKRVFVSDCGS